MMTMMHSSLWIGTARGSRRCYIPILSSSSFSSYKEEKLAAKELRRQRFEAKMDRLVRLRTRRDGRPIDVKKAEFTSWYDKRRTYHEVMDRKARQQEKEWKIEVAAVVERLPLVTPDMEPWEAEYTALRKHLDQFTWDYPSELMQSRKSNDDEDDEEEIMVVLPRETEADATNDITTTNRRLKTRIFFVENASDVPPEQWKFPTVLLQDGERLTDAAMRLAKDKLGEEVELLALSNCPIAVDLDVEEEGEFFGTKTFFMKLQYFRGDVKPSTGDASYGWLDRTELVENAEACEGINAGKFYRYML
ncbi:hypothetical protein MHU86_4271 [Fragilaria crotonensis]|nr:hypothetical protein MHU86_4271 [Fragilaria crotonensis]